MRIGEAATGISNQMSDVGLAVERAKEPRPSRCRPAPTRSPSSRESGALTDLTSTDDDIDRQLKQSQLTGVVDDELAKLKAELGTGDAAPAELDAADAAEVAAPSGDEQSAPAGGEHTA